MNTINWNDLFTKFFAQVAQGTIEIYNEVSLQYELGIYLRTSVGHQANLKVQFERPVTFFGLNRHNFEKKEIDICLFNEDFTDKYAIELKYPRAGQHPEQMFKMCQDICFIEQLARSGFKQGFFIVVADDPLFYLRGRQDGIYQHFRAGIPITGIIYQPTNAGTHSFEIQGEYHIHWQYSTDIIRYAVVSTNL